LNQRVKRIAFTVLALALLSTAASPVSAEPRSATTLRADVAEWSIVPSAGVVGAGTVRLVVRNFGVEPHQVIVVRTHAFAQRLRLNGDRAAARPVAAPVVVAPGATRTVVVHLKRGSYVLLDNLPWHYWKGTSAAFAVR
jgi:uncharacterized cupredoxin-like copper-binding protein